MSDFPAITYLPIAAVLARTSLSQSTLYDEMAAGRFPRSRKLTRNRVGWVESEVNGWCADREAHQASEQEAA